MKTFLKVIGIIFVILVLAVGAIFWIGSSVDKTQAELDAFAEPMIREMVDSNWNSDVIKSYGTEQFFAGKDFEKNLVVISKAARRLGKIKKYNGVQNFRNTKSTNGNNVALVFVTADFEAGYTEINLNLSKIGDVWKMNSINIQFPPELFNELLKNSDEK